ncbi:MAG: potassium channel protein, partial [Thermoplasmata archaeon]|nr:potassium channel protein [Thermoplasmata archaeon]
LFFLVEAGHYTIFDSMYWSIVTLGTVGYGDVVATNSAAKVLTSGVIATQIFLLAYLLSMIMTAVGEESQRRALGTYGTQMKGHIVVLGYSAVGRAAVRELLLQGQTVAVVTDRAEDVPNIRTLAEERRIFVTYGPPAETEMLQRVNVPEAHSVIVCTADDATNLIGSLNVRALSPSVRIVVSVGRPELRDTLRAAGVTYVASPADMGGRLCASAAFEPDVANAIEDITAADIRSDIQEYVLGERTPISRTSFGEAEALVRHHTGCILIGCAHKGANGEFVALVAPPPDRPLAPGDAIIIVGSIENSRRFHTWFGVEQGR